MVSSTCIFVSESMYMDLSLGNLCAKKQSFSVHHENEQATKEKILHGRKGCMDSGAANFDGDDGI